MLPIAVDAMGGDNAPGEIVAGAAGPGRVGPSCPRLLLGGGAFDAQRGRLLRVAVRGRSVRSAAGDDGVQPVQLLVAGKAHPADGGGKEIIEQVVAEMGSRSPAYPDTEKEFRVIFVILSRDGA